VGQIKYLGKLFVETMIFKVHVLATQRTDAFLVDVQDVSEGKFTWQVERAYDDFQHLKGAMKDNFTDSSATWKSMALFPTPESLGNFLLLALSYLGESIWSYEPILYFLDNSPDKSFISQLKILKLTNKVAFLEKKSSELEKSQENLLQNFKTFQNKIDQYLKAAHESVSENSVTGANAGPRLSWEIKNTGISPHRSLDPHLSINSLATTDSGISAGDNEQAIDSLLQDGDAFEDDDDLAGGSRSGTASSRETSIPNSIYLPAELLPLGDNASVAHQFENVVDSTLQNIAPVELQILHRHSVVLLLKKLVRVALGSNTFEYGVQMTRCLLPDDPIKITVMLSKTLLPTWHTVLCEYLTTYAEKANAYGGSSFVPPDEDEQNLDPYFQDLAPTANHFIGNVSHVKQNLMHSVTMIVDSISVEISPNNRAELCLTSFVEEVSQVVGANELFKRSLLLIRAWWALETQPYVGCSIRHYLSDFHLFVMLAGVFNQYSKYIKSPMVAFCFFLAEYSGYDGISKAISIRGFAPFQTKTSNQPILSDKKPHHIIAEALLERYWVLYNISHVQEQQEQQQRKRCLSSDDEPSNSESGSSPVSRSHSVTQTNELASAAAVAMASPTTPVGEISSIEKLLTDTVRENMKALSTNHLFLFDRSSYNIIHPLNNTNMITEKLSQRRVSRLAKAFQSGAVAVAAILRGTSDSESLDSMNSCFSNVRSFNNLWNQSQVPVDLGHIMKNPFELTEMMQAIQYSNLMIESAVNDDGLLILAQEILAVKGPLPVGEIGKILAETTSIPNLSTKLKERYGGLKKYLEAYQDRFVISNDHPFNPNVILRCSLSPEHLEMIEKGNFPHQFVARAKKASAAASAARRKKSHPSLNVPLANIDPASFTTNLPAMASPPPPPVASYRPTSTSQHPGQQSQTSPLQQQQQLPSSSAQLSNLTPQQQNLVHATAQKLKNMTHTASSSGTTLNNISNNNNINNLHHVANGAPPASSATSVSGMPLSVAQLAQQYGGSGSGNSRPKTYPPPGAVKLPLTVNNVNSSNSNSNLLPGIGPSGTNYFGSSNNAFGEENNGGFYPSPPHPGRPGQSPYGNAGNSGMSVGGTNMRLGSNPYASHLLQQQQQQQQQQHHHQQQQQQQRLSGSAPHCVDISAFANAAAAHWSQTSRRSSLNSDYGDLSSVGNASNSGNNSNNNSNHNSLNLNSVGSNRDNVRNLFNPSPNPFTPNHNKSSSYFGDSSGGNNLSSFLSASGNSGNSLGLNVHGVVGGSSSNSRPSSLGHDSSAAANAGASFGFGLDVGHHQHDISKLGLEMDVLGLTGSSNTNSSSAGSNGAGHHNGGHGHSTQKYNLW
jgi:hypothetical protein